MKLFKNIIMSILLLLIGNHVFAYQTVVVDFEGVWTPVYYTKNNRDAIVQFVREGYDKTNWVESIVFHTYKWTNKSGQRTTTIPNFTSYLLSETAKRNKSMQIQYLKKDAYDTIVSWCVEKNDEMVAQCEMLRVTDSFEGIVSMHYIVKNPEYFPYVANKWYDILDKAKIYQNYFRTDRILNRAMTFEL